MVPGSDNFSPLAAGMLTLRFQARISNVDELRQPVECREDDPPKRISKPVTRGLQRGWRWRVNPKGCCAQRARFSTSCFRWAQPMFSLVSSEGSQNSHQNSTQKDSKKKCTCQTPMELSQRERFVAPAADVSDILRVDGALQRRGLAAELTGVISVVARDLLRKNFFQNVLGACATLNGLGTGGEGGDEEAQKSHVSWQHSFRRD